MGAKPRVGAWLSPFCRGETPCTPPGQDGAGGGQMGHIGRLLMPRLEPSQRWHGCRWSRGGRHDRASFSRGPGYCCCQTAGCYQVLQWECCCCHGSQFILASCHHSMSPSKPEASSLPWRVPPCPHPQAPRQEHRPQRPSPVGQPVPAVQRGQTQHQHLPHFPLWLTPAWPPGPSEVA